MTFSTFLQVKTKVLEDMDLQDEVFTQNDELLGLCNEGIHEAEMAIGRLCEDYLRVAPRPFALVTGTQVYDLETVCPGIWADKIRDMTYAAGARVYQVRRMRYSTSFQEQALIRTSPTPDYYRYDITNDGPTGANPGRKIVLWPVSQETSASNIMVTYIREALRVTDDTSPVDLPEFHAFIEQFIKVRIYEKEMHPNLGFAVAALEKERQYMMDALANRVPDNQDVLEADFSHYREHS